MNSASNCDSNDDVHPLIAEDERTETFSQRAIIGALNRWQSSQEFFQHYPNLEPREVRT